MYSISTMIYIYIYTYIHNHRIIYNIYKCFDCIGKFLHTCGNFYKPPSLLINTPSSALRYCLNQAGISWSCAFQRFKGQEFGEVGRELVQNLRSLLGQSVVQLLGGLVVSRLVNDWWLIGDSWTTCCWLQAWTCSNMAGAGKSIIRS